MRTDTRSLYRQALDRVGRTIGVLEPDQLTLATPCADWSLRQLLEHMIGQNHGFAAAVRGNGADSAVWQPRAFDDQLVRAWAASAQDVGRAFDEADPGEPVDLAEFTTRGPFALAAAQSFHLLDTVIHGWDIAATIDADYPCDAETADLALRLASHLPSAPEDRGPQRPFRPVVDLRDHDRPLELALALTGRDPAWKAS